MWPLVPLVRLTLPFSNIYFHSFLLDLRDSRILLEDDAYTALLAYKQYKYYCQKIQINLGDLLSSTETVATQLPLDHTLGVPSSTSSQDVLDSLLAIGHTPLHDLVDYPSSGIIPTSLTLNSPTLSTLSSSSPTLRSVTLSTLGSPSHSAHTSTTLSTLASRTSSTHASTSYAGANAQDFASHNEDEDNFGDGDETPNDVGDGDKED